MMIEKKLNNKGFTLVELLAVFVILISVSLVAVGGITSSLEKREVDECKDQQELAVSAAKMYFALDGTDKTSVKVSILKSGGYFSDDKNLDRLNDDDLIAINGNAYTYNGEKIGCSCDSKWC